jgi:endoglucanase
MRLQKARPTTAMVMPTILMVLVPIIVCAQYAPSIFLNQEGFYRNGPKHMFVTGMPSGSPFFVVDLSSADTVFRSKLQGEFASRHSAMKTSRGDFSGFRRSGRYKISCGSLESHPFNIGEKVHHAAAVAALKGFYYQRSNQAIDAEFGGKWQRPAGHPDTAVLIHSSAGGNASGTKYISSPGGWYDAGDYNKYIVNSGITMSTLLMSYEDFSFHHDSINVGIPESADGIPDIIDEVVYNLRWMLTMQDTDGGVYHKCTNAAFDGMVMPGVTKLPRYVVQKSTSATLNLAAVAAHAARVIKKYPVFASLVDSCTRSARSAWQWAVKNPGQIYDQNRINSTFDPDIATGEYGDKNLQDEFFWAASELYILGGEAQFLKVIHDGLRLPASLPSWNNVAMLGYYSLIRHKKDVPSAATQLITAMQDSILRLADAYAASSVTSAFGTPMGHSARDFIWGSSSVAANQGIVLVNALMIRRDRKYQDAALANLDYLMGRNATGYCFLTGFGTKSPMHIHHRPSEADGVAEPVPGLLSGGPNPGMQDKCKYEFKEPETAFVDDVCSYASNEIAINWNAPFVYLAHAIEALRY